MIFLIIRLAIIGFIGYLIFRGIMYVLTEVFSDTRRCTRCEGKGWWQGNRVREKCEWCEGSGRVSKDFPLR
ncbi:MAG: hypothetical protein AAFQ83_01425 [Bacteroidota bacterium]